MQKTFVTLKKDETQYRQFIVRKHRLLLGKSHSDI